MPAKVKREGESRYLSLAGLILLHNRHNCNSPRGVNRLIVCATITIINSWRCFSDQAKRCLQLAHQARIFLQTVLHVFVSRVVARFEQGFAKVFPLPPVHFEMMPFKTSLLVRKRASRKDSLTFCR